jgi:predicted CXXCH cytochrome family protein
MKRKSAFVIFLLAAGIAFVVVCMEMEPHKFPQDKCRTCHAIDGSGKIVGKQLTGPVSFLCEKCHAKIFKNSYMHPVNVRPRSVRIPADFPLSRSGEIVCSTCHDIHSPYFTPYGAPSHYLRRYEVGRKFCEACHPGSIKAGHAGTIGEAHFQSKYVQTSSSQAIDPLSMNCISCHDGSYASSVSVNAGAWTHQKELMPHDAGSHPIGVDYENARTAKGRRTPLRPIGMVDRRIQFFDGKVGCGSCHDPYSTIEKRLVMSDDRSKLCFSCHQVGRE